MRTRSVLIRLEPRTFQQLADLARREERGIDQQAAYFVRRALQPQLIASVEEGSEVADALTH